MDNNPLVSIGLPIYNRPLPFKKALDSLLSQTYKNIEINIGDNSENSESEKVFEEYRNDNRIKYYKHDKNIGATANFEFVRDISNGKYFMWAADDDYWDSTFIEKAVEKLENDPEAVACWPQVQFFDDNGRVFDSVPSSCYNQDLSYDNITNRLIKLNLQCSWFEFYCLMKTEIAKNFDFQRYKLIGIDVVFINHLVLSGKCLMINETLFYYYFNPEDGYERRNYKSNSYNEYARINPNLDLFITCFYLVLTSKILNIYEKIYYYFKFWAKILLSKPTPNIAWIDRIIKYPSKKFFMLAIRKINFSSIFICIPLFIFFFMSKMRFIVKHLRIFILMKAFVKNILKMGKNDE
jgi:GT2 family glycosyltransferase